MVTFAIAAGAWLMVLIVILGLCKAAGIAEQLERARRWRSIDRERRR